MRPQPDETARATISATARSFMHSGLARRGVLRQRLGRLAAAAGTFYPAAMKGSVVAALLAPLTLLVAGCERQEPVGQEAAGQEAAGEVKGVSRAAAGRPLPDIELRNADDEPASLAGEAGEPLLVNLWATWCAPCVKELPTLEALGRREGAPRVVAVSQDMAPRGSVDAFLEQHRLAELEVWHDPKMALSSAAGVEVLPTTILYDAEGREVWRFVGDLDWVGPEAAKLVAEASAAAR